jgi:uncharacterized protein
MHYYIDGYNLLFRHVHVPSGKNFEAARNKLITELDAKIAHLKAHVTVVFDAPFQNDELKRGHFRSLEIIFSAKAQSADDLLIEIFKHHPQPRTLCLVTSDRELQKRAKLFSVAFQSVEDFMRLLRKKETKQAEEKKIPFKKQALKAPTRSSSSPEAISKKAAKEERKQPQQAPHIVSEKEAPEQSSLLAYRTPIQLKVKPKSKKKEKTELPDLMDLPKWQGIFEKNLKKPH